MGDIYGNINDFHFYVRWSCRIYVWYETDEFCLEQSAGSGIRNLLEVNKNRVFNYGIGIGATALVQSSSASSIMTVGLAHAKIVSVKQGSGFILGAKVGTTLTAFIFALSGISKGGFSISSVFASIAFVGVIIIFSTSNETLNKIAPFLIGFGMLFIGLEDSSNWRSRFNPKHTTL